MTLLDPFTREQPKRAIRVIPTTLIDRIIEIENQKKPLTIEILKTGDRCPWCKELGNKNRLVYRRGWHIDKPFIGCSRYPECSFTAACG